MALVYSKKESVILKTQLRLLAITKWIVFFVSYYKVKLFQIKKPPGKRGSFYNELCHTILVQDTIQTAP